MFGFLPIACDFEQPVILENLGFTYYRYFAQTNDSQHLFEAIKSYNKSINLNSTQYLSYWDLALCYYFSSEYQLSLIALNNYKKHAPAEYFDRKEYKQMLKNCSTELK